VGGSFSSVLGLRKSKTKLVWEVLGVGEKCLGCSCRRKWGCDCKAWVLGPDEVL
jgi:hypothetical protein